MANGGNIEFGIGFNVDKSALIDLQSQLKGILSMDALDLKLGSDSTKPIEEIKKGLQEAQSAATTLDRALENAFNNDLGTLNVTKFQQSLTNAGTSLSSLYHQLQGAGDAGVSAFRNITTQVLTANTYLKQSDKIIAKMAETLGNTIKWNISSGAVNNLSGAIQQAWGFTKALDGSLNDIQIVTSKSSEDMKKFAIQANDAAKALGTTTTAYTDAALTFYQQGLSDEDVAARAETSLKVSNVTGLSGDQSAEYVTAVLNGYKVAAADAEQAMDKLAAVGAHTASSLAELSEAMAKVSSSANAMGVSEDQLAATLATVISVTRQDASTVGTAFKTIYARISDIKAGSEDAEVSLGNYTKKMAEMGFSVLDSAGNMRDLGEVMEEIGGKWETLTKEQQISLAQTMAGTRQYNNLIALFDNWAQYEDALNVSMESSGTLQEQQEIYAESLTAKLNELTAAKEGLYNSFIDSDSMKGAIEVFTKLVQVMDNFIQGIGGGGNALLGLGAILVKVFSKQIANSISTVITNVGHLFDKLDQAAAKQRLVAEWKVSGQSDAVIDKLIAKYDTLQSKLSNLTAEQYNAAMEMLKTQSQAEDSANQWDEATKAAQDYIKAVTDIDVNILDENNNIKELNKDEQYEVEYKLKNAKNKYNEDTGEIDTANELVRLAEERKKVEQEIQKLRDKKDNGEITEQEKKRLQALRVNLRSIKQEMKEVDKTTQEFFNDLSKIAQEDLDIIDDKKAKQEINNIINELQTKLSQYDGLNMSDIIDDTDIQTLSEKLTKALASAGQGLDNKIQDILNQISSASALEGEGLHANVQQGDQQFEDGINAMELQAKVQSITELTSAVMALGSAYSTIQNLGSIWSNDDLEITQKLGQTLGALVGIFTTVTTAIATLSKTKLGEQLITKLLNAEWMKQILVNQGVTVSEGEVTMATLTLKGALVSLSVIVLSVTAAMAGLALAAAGINKLLNLSVEANKHAAAEAQALTDAEHEKTEALREQKEAIDAVIDGYQELYGQYKSGQITLEELRQKTYDLCMQYGEEDLALKALIADQEELNNLMKEAQSKADSELYNQSKKEADYDKDAIKRGIMADAGKREDSFGYGKSTIDLKGMGARNTKEIDFAEELEKVGINFENDDHISTDSLVEAYTENYDKLMEVLSKYSDLDAAEQIGEYLDNQKDNLDKYKDAVDTEAQLYLENELKSRYDTETGFAEGQDFHTATTESATKATEEKYGARTEDNAEDWDAYYAERLEAAQNYYAQYTELANAARIEEINNSLAATGAIKEGMEISQKELNYIYMHLETAEAYKDLNEFLRVYEKDIEIANSKAILLELDAQLSDPDKEAFTDEELASYFGLEGFQDAINMSLEQLKGIDFKDQKIALMGATQKMKTELLDSYTEAMKSNQEDLQAISDKLSDSEIKHNSFLKNRYQNFVDEIGTGPQEALNEINDFEAKKQEIENTYRGSDNKDVRKEKIEELKQEYDSILNLEKAYGDLDNAKKVITGDDEGNDDYSNLLEVEQELQALQEQGIGLNDIDTTQQLQEQQTALQENIEKSKAEMESLKSEIISMNETAANSAQSLRDLNDLKEQGAFVDIEGTTQDEGKAAYNKRAGELYEAARMEDLDSEEVRDYAHSLKDMADNSEELSDDLKDNLEDCQDLAIQIKRMNKGVDSLSKNWDEWSDILKKSSKTSEEYADAMSGAKEAVADLLDVTEDFISDDFVTENMEDIAKAADGDADAIDRLRASMLEDIVMHLDLDDSALSNEQLLGVVQGLQADLDAMGDLEVGAEIDDAKFIAACNEMIEQAGLTTDQVNALFSGMGFDVNLASSNEPIEYVRPEQITHTEVEGTDTFKGEGGMPSFTYPTRVRTWTETVNKSVEKGEVGAVAMSTDGSTPEIKSVTKKAGGGMNNKSSSNGGGKKGGGGGGGAAKPDKKDFVDPKTDRYHDVEVALKGINKQMEILNDNRKNLTGAALADSYREELELLDEQINALTQKQKLQKEEQKELQSQGRDISRYGKKVHIKSLSEQGVKFDDKGNITNYNEAIVNRTNEYNQMVEDYNNLSADQQTDELKAQMDEAKKDYDQFIEDMERYETLTQDEMEETAKEIADALNKKIELKIEKFSMTIDLKLETREAEQRLEDFKSKMEHRDKTAAGRTKTAANKFKNYMDPETGVQAEIDKVNKIKDDIKKMQSGGHSDVYSEYDEESGTWVDNTAKAQEDLKKYTEQMMNDMEDMEDLMDEINQGLLDTFDEIQEGFDDQIAGYDAVADQISHNISLIEKLYGDNASDKLGEWYDAQLDNSIGKVDMLKKSADFWQKQMKNAENDDAYKKAKENWLKSMNDLNAAVENSLDIVIAKYENSIDQVFDKLNNSLTGGKGLKYVGEEWELINTNADRYLDTINATYEVQKLQGKYQDAIKNTDSISAQKKLNDLMSQEVKYLEKKDKLTQYDIDRANMKYDIALKQIALEEAQQNKSSLRLKRDSQGNYSYQYAGDEDDIAKKQQELIDAQNSLYNLDKDQYKQNLDDMYTYYSEFQEKMAEVAKTYGRDSEEYEKYKLLYAEQYGKLINNIVAENEYIKLNLMESTYDELNSLYENDQASFEAMTHMKAEQFLNMDKEMLFDLKENLVPGFNGSIQDMINTFKGEGGFEGVMTGVWNAISQAAKDFQTNIQKISEASGTDLYDLRVNTNKIFTKLKGWVEENDKVIEKAETSKAAYDKIAEGIKAMADQYKAAKNNATHAATESTELQKNLNEETWKELEAQTALNNLVAKLKEWNDTKPKTKTFVTNYVDNSSGSGSGGSGGNSSGSGTPTLKSGSSTVKWYAYGSSGKLSETGYSSQTAAKNAWPKATKFLTYKTGGYTGTWANGSREENGKLAFLHQKELVLNEKDTSNFLDAIKEVKSGFNFDNITKAISSQMVDVQRESMRFQNQIARQLNTIIDSIMRIDQSLEQQVNINARFEDVRSSQAIIEAMDQLTNRASQAAFNVRRKW